ncbi:MAG: deoxyribose-phosphate aldolase [Phycisphaeraceae bacterium]|nr:deoxyribose-phosphate aldolase [Phycisphaeraceae bacterium]
MSNIASIIDHTILKAEATQGDVMRLCDEAIEQGFASVCVNGNFVKAVRDKLAGSGVKTCAVAGFPLGAMKPMVKAIEATSMVKDGADEVDFVAHLPTLLASDAEGARTEFAELAKAARSVLPGVVIKVIIESAALMKDADGALCEKRIAAACEAAQAAGIDFVKTSTGFHGAGGASVEAVRLMKKHAGPMKVKASGGIRTLDDAKQMIDAGADRLGCSAGVQIVSGQGEAGSGY